MAGGAQRAPKPVRRVWVPQVAVDVDALWTRTNVAEARGLDDAGKAVAKRVRQHRDKGRRPPSASTRCRGGWRTGGAGRSWRRRTGTCTLARLPSKDAADRTPPAPPIRPTR